MKDHLTFMQNQVADLRDALETVHFGDYVITAGDGVTYYVNDDGKNVQMSFNVLEAYRMRLGTADRLAARMTDGQGNPLKAVLVREAIQAEIEKTEDCIQFFSEAIKKEAV